ncbi:indole-3-glycerol phosphate synthase TrpC [Frisingicoccus sp.]|uniref:indole-3-glycerol phosphate synthase TrpC n=1 Tax=Frisingicoccus sp. TaxID=1918627 RepID=UPI003AB4B32A
MILDDLAAAARKRMERDMKRAPLEYIKKRAESVRRTELAQAEKGAVNTENISFGFEKNLRQKEMQFICEVKKASPSKGLIAAHFPYVDIAKEYEAAGAAAISVLTETDYFLGDDRYLRQIYEAVQTPLLRKDFTVDAYQIYQAKTLGASAVLLICAILDEKRIRSFIEICDSLGMSTLVEAHDAEEVRMADCAGARIIGVNNRNLKDFTVDIGNSLRLRELVPGDTLFVAESGISTPEDIRALREGGVNGVLIGESLMRAKDKKAMLDYLRGKSDDTN